MKIYLAADHAGFELKEGVKKWFKELGYQVYDEGAFEYDEQDDYPDFIKIVGKQVSSAPDDSKAIIFGGSGQGEAIVANRFSGVRAIVYAGGDRQPLVLSRTHNNANVLSIGAHFVDLAEALEVIQTWLAVDFPGEERHLRRIEKIDSQAPIEHEF
ncbi:MAG: RpiB/LacA/LacB family sugar-phosphate isomerase [Patescibacteria group bacterium]|nr:RpiB/LacA/LacB family sugar-phosphate isomerase [Patescibacteria group bacterium]